VLFYQRFVNHFNENIVECKNKMTPALFCRCFIDHLGYLALIGLSFRLAGLVVLCLADSIPVVFVAVALAGPHSMTVSSAKSLISKTVSEGEMGRTFSLLSSGETLSNLVGTVRSNVMM